VAVNSAFRPSEAVSRSLGPFDVAVLCVAHCDSRTVTETSVSPRRQFVREKPYRWCLDGCSNQ
jgi:hypothetical protein